jgi:hypothetical protein
VLSTLRSDSKSSEMAQASHNAAHSTGAACPFESTKLSTLRASGVLGSQRNW